MSGGDNRAQIVRELHESARTIKGLAVCASDIEAAARAIEACYRGGGKVIFCGNGGSAADAQHLAAEFVGRYRLERKSLPALALTANTSTLTAISNDYGFAEVFARQAQAWVNENDALVGISTSGNSENVVLALEKAREIGAVTVALTGESGGRMAQAADITIRIPSEDTPRVQEAQITAGHIICGLVENALFSDMVGLGAAQAPAAGRGARGTGAQ